MLTRTYREGRQSPQGRFTHPLAKLVQRERPPRLPVVLVAVQMQHTLPSPCESAGKNGLGKPCTPVIGRHNEPQGNSISNVNDRAGRRRKGEGTPAKRCHTMLLCGGARHTHFRCVCSSAAPLSCSRCWRLKNGSRRLQRLEASIPSLAGWFQQEACMCFTTGRNTIV